ncbi:MAG TPA: HAD hydrolase-like protein [Polyangiales bacterium]|nr:HAD hydrolase-like protein [Polyangiales bacterium]
MTAPDRRNLIGIDLDGTIEDSRDDMVAAAVRVRHGLGLPPRADELLRPYVNGGMEQLYRACFDDFLGAGPEKRLRIVQQAYEADYLANVCVDTKLYDGIADALHGLVRLGMLVCVTNKPERISRALLEALGVGDLFSSVVGGDSCAHAKPHPVMLETAAARCGFDRARGTAFMIGDTNGDIQLARAYGANVVWCAWGYVSAPSEAPDAQARHPQELFGILEQRIRAV